MKKAKEYRAEAEKKNLPFSGRLAVILLIAIAICLAIDALGLIGSGVVKVVFIVVASVLLWLVTGPFMMSFARVTMKVYNGEQPNYVDVFDTFKSGEETLRAIVLNVLLSIFVFLWSLLLIVPGIIMSLAYSMSYYVSIFNPDLTEFQCIRTSRQLMKGYKWKFFCLMISYIGWIILCVMTLGILSLWVAPKIEQATYLFYVDVCNNKK